MSLQFTYFAIMYAPSLHHDAPGYNYIMSYCNVHVHIAMQHCTLDVAISPNLPRTPIYPSALIHRRSILFSVLVCLIKHA